MRRSLIFLPAFLFLPTLAHAQDLTASVSSTRPTEESIVVHDEPESGGWQWRWTEDTGRRDVGQTFTAPEDFTLAKLALQIRSGSAPAVSKAPFTLIFSRFVDAGGNKPAEMLATWKGVLPANDTGVVYGQGKWLELATPPLKLESGKVYGFTLTFDTVGPSGKGVVFSVPQKETYPAGTGLFSTDGVTWNKNFDFNFLVIPTGAKTVLARPARTFVVDRNGGTEFKTLNSAAVLAQAGDTIQVKPNTGPYREVLFIPASGTADAPITFDGGGNLITGFEPITTWEEKDGATTFRLTSYPVVLTYKGERLRQDAATGQFTKYATLNEAKDTLTLLPGTSKDGWEISRRPFAVRIYNSSFQTYKNVRASGSTNDGFNLHGTGSGLIFQNIEGFQNLDEGFSSHDEIKAKITNGKFWGNDNGIGNVGHSDTIATNIETHDNLGHGFWLDSGTGNIKGVRSWNNGATQIFFNKLTATLENVTAYTPAYKSKPYVSYMESKGITTSTPVVNSNSQITGAITTDPAPEPPK